MTAELARAGGPIGCAGLVLLLVGTERYLRVAGLGLWALGGLLLAIHLAPTAHRPLIVAACVLGLGAAAGIAALFLRWPWVLPLAALACVPARIPVHVGSEQADLLIPLYGVVLAAALALAYQLWRGDERVRELGPLAWPLAALVAWSGLSLAWSQDLRQGAIELLFFFLPFGLLAIAVARLPWSRRWLTGLYGLLGVMAVVFAVVGIYQWANRDVFWNPKVIVANAYAPGRFFYRVNSVFYDPSIYGRFLVLAILASLVIVLYQRGGRLMIGLAAAIAATWIGLLFSFSQSSFVALVAGVLAAAAFAWKWRAVAAIALVGAVLVTVGFSAPRVRHSLFGHAKSGLNNASSGRYKLVTNGIKIALDHPIQGVGIGGFKKAYGERFHLKGKEPKKAASHDTPVTVAAETGIPGLLLLGWLFVAAMVAAWRRVSSSFEGRTCLIVGLLFGAIAVHSLFYNAFFEDPMMWALLGLVPLALVARSRTEAAE
jgi:O-antigen ligase